MTEPIYSSSEGEGEDEGEKETAVDSLARKVIDFRSPGSNLSFPAADSDEDGNDSGWSFGLAKKPLHSGTRLSHDNPPFPLKPRLPQQPHHRK